MLSHARLAICLLACLPFTQMSCRHVQPRAAGRGVIVLGIDGMDPKFVQRHWDALPNLRRLREQGDFKPLGTTIPPQSPVAWSTFITGTNPGVHGVFDFVHRDPATLMPFSSMAVTEPAGRVLEIGPYVLPLSRGRVRMLRKGAAFWQILGQHEIPATVIRMPNNFPPVECEGRTLAGMGAPDLRGGFGTFTFFTDDPAESTRQVSGGEIVRVNLEKQHADLRIQGPANTLRRDRRPASITLSVDRDPGRPAARFTVGGRQVILNEGEWSGWIRVEFPLLRGLQGAAGMFRIYAKKLRPVFQVYVSPINIDPERAELPISTPESYSRELAAATGPFYTQGMPEDTAALRAGVLTREEYLAQSRMVSREHLRLLDYELERFAGGLLFFHFFGIDQDSHILWGKYETELLETYRTVDTAIGRVMKRAAGATVIVMSDHGFAAFDRAVHLNTWLWKEGFLQLDDPANAGDKELFEHVDWSNTQAYALGLNAVYLNMDWRERHGIVVPGEDSERVLRRIAERLRGFRDPENGRPVVEKVYLAREVYHGPALDSAPDLIVGWAPGYRASWQTALGAVPPGLIEDNKEEWRADHCMATESLPGVLVSNRKIGLPYPRLQDLTVTLLAEFGIPPGEAMQGRRIFPSRD